MKSVGMKFGRKKMEKSIESPTILTKDTTLPSPRLELVIL